MSPRNNLLYISLFIFLVLVMLVSIAFGAVSIAPSSMLGALRHYLMGSPPADIYEGVFLQLRLPRVLLTVIVGAILGVSGVMMQGLFRNPIVEPGLLGTSSGAAFGAACIFVLAAKIPLPVKNFFGPMLVPVAAFAGGLLATSLVYSFARRMKGMPVTSLLLAGIAVNAVGICGTGFLSYIARDPQARSITFWSLGSFSGATWVQVFITGLLLCLLLPFVLRAGKELNALILGEEEAAALGVNTGRLKTRILIITTALISVATAFVGVISFVGLIVPHILRFVLGSNNQKLLPASLLLGASMLTLADLCARLLLAPAEMPIGILTSLVGAPVFIILLRRFYGSQGGNHD